MTDEELEAMHTRKRERTLARKNKKIRKIQMRRITWILFSCLVILLDQISKWVVMEKIIRPARYKVDGVSFFDWYMHKPDIIPFTEIPITSYFSLIMAWNTGVSFSLLNNIGEYGYILLICVSLIIITLFGMWLWTAEKRFHCFCYALVIGGALGNVIDRFRFGAVIDFLDFHINDYRWPAFNFADMAIVSGISLLIIVSLFFETKTRRRYRKNYRKRKKEEELYRERFKID